MRILLLAFLTTMIGLAAAQQPTPTPSPAITPVPGSLANPTPSPAATATPFATPTPMFSPTPTPTATPTPTPTPFESPTATPTPIGAPSPSPTPSMSEGVQLRMISQSTEPSAQPSQEGQRPSLNRTPTQPPAVPPTSAPVPSAQPSPTTEPARPGSTGLENATPSYPDLLPHFDYDSKTGLEQREINIEKRGNIMFIEVNYAGANGDRVPAYIAIPHGKGPFPAIIWGHWLKQGSPLANKDEFVDEALVLARAGVLSLLIDAPQARHDFAAEEKDPLDAARQQSDAAVHQVIDLRRAVDLLLLRADVDRKRIAYVGHSWDAHVGAILAGVDSRICCFVLMASGYSDEADTFASTDPQTTAHIKQVGADRVREYFHDYAYDDPIYFLGHTTNESIFLQFASGDHVTRERAQKYLDSFSSRDKQMAIYDAPHALNAAARLDRVRWLQKRLGFKKVDEQELNAIPQLK
ncbi:MAG TPA: hypothetical protein VKH81_10380 [Candidatus Angelobacter sp.]|nr:hypothetical protein [Candidatus Angelobacter sp.]